MRGAAAVPGDQLFGERLEGSLVAVEMEQRGRLGAISLGVSPGARRGVEDIRGVVLHVGRLHHRGVEVQRYPRIAQHIQRGNDTWDIEVFGYGGS